MFQNSLLDDTLYGKHFICITNYKKYAHIMRGSRKFCQMGSKFDNVFFSFFVDEGVEDPKVHYKWAIIGPLAKRNLDGVSLAGRWWPNIDCWLASFVIFQRIRTSIAIKPDIFVIFQGGSKPLSPPLALPMHRLAIMWAMIRQIPQNKCAPSEDSCQPEHPPSLTRVFTVRWLCN